MQTVPIYLSNPVRKNSLLKYITPMNSFGCASNILPVTFGSDHGNQFLLWRKRKTLNKKQQVWQINFDI